MQKLKNNEARPKFTGSYKKNRVLGNLTKYNRDMKYTKLNTQRPKRKKII